MFPFNQCNNFINIDIFIGEHIAYLAPQWGFATQDTACHDMVIYSEFDLEDALQTMREGTMPDIVQKSCCNQNAPALFRKLDCTGVYICQPGNTQGVFKPVVPATVR